MFQKNASLIHLAYGTWIKMTGILAIYAPINIRLHQLQKRPASMPTSTQPYISVSSHYYRDFWCFLQENTTCVLLQINQLLLFSSPQIYLPTCTQRDKTPPLRLYNPLSQPELGGEAYPLHMWPVYFTKFKYDSDLVYHTKVDDIYLSCALLSVCAKIKVYTFIAR